MKKLALEKHLDNFSSKEGALYIINEYLSMNIIEPSKLVNLTSLSLIASSRREPNTIWVVEEIEATKAEIVYVKYFSYAHSAAGFD